jgi:hypothetical protein
MAQRLSNAEAKITGVRIHKPRADSSTASVPMDQYELVEQCRLLDIRDTHNPCRWLVFNRSVIHFVREDDESMKPPSNVKTPAQYIASLPADRAKTIAMVRALVNKHIPRGYDECLVWGTIGWTIPLSRYPDTYNKQPICYVALSSQKNYCSLYLMGAFWNASQLEQLKAAFKAAGKKLDMGKCCVHFESPDDLPLEARSGSRCTNNRA